MRLIDADKLTAGDFYDCTNGDECMMIVNEQPTAYDVEAVVEQIRKGYDKESASPVRRIRLCDAIEVVMGGIRNE